MVAGREFFVGLRTEPDRMSMLLLPGEVTTEFEQLPFQFVVFHRVP